MGIAFALLFEQCPEQRLGTHLARVVFIRCAKALGDFLVLFLAAFERPCPLLASLAADVAAKHFVFDVCYCHPRRKTEGSTKRLGVASRVIVSAEDLGVAERLR